MKNFNFENEHYNQITMGKKSIDELVRRQQFSILMQAKKITLQTDNTNLTVNLSKATLNTIEEMKEVSTPEPWEKIVIELIISINDDIEEELMSINSIIQA